MGLAKNETELANRIKTFLKAKVANTELTYEELAKEMKKHGLKETKASVTNKLARGDIPGHVSAWSPSSLGTRGSKVGGIFSLLGNFQCG